MTPDLAERGRVKATALLLVLICSGQFMVFLDTTVVNVALPAVRTDLGADVTQLQWVVNTYTLAFACFMLTSGALADRLGAKRVFLASLFTFAATSMWCALAGNIANLLVARFFQGMAGAAVVPVSLALITELYPDRSRRARAIAVWAAASGLALATGPVIGGELVDGLGWQSVFWINVPIGVLAVGMLARLVPASARSLSRRADPVAQVLLISAVGLATFALMEGNDIGWVSPLVISSFVASAVLFAGFVGWERRHPDPMLPVQFFANSNYSAASTINLLVFAGLYGAIFLFTLTLQIMDRLSPAEAGIRLLALSVTIGVAAPIGTAIAEFLGARTVLVVGALSAGIGLLGLATVDPGDAFGSYWWPLTVLGLGAGFCGPAGTVLLLSSVPEQYAGVASATGLTMRQIGAVFGVAIAGGQFAAHIHRVYVWFAIAALVAAVVAAAFVRRIPVQDPGSALPPVESLRP